MRGVSKNGRGGGGGGGGVGGEIVMTHSEIHIFSLLDVTCWAWRASKYNRAAHRKSSISSLLGATKV